MDAALPPGQVGSDPTADLARCDLLAGTSHEQLRALAALLSPGTAEAGAVLLRHGAVPDRFLFLTGGRASVRLRTRSRDQLVEVPAGSIVGEIALLRGRPHEATVTAATDVRFLVGDSGAFAQLLAVPEVGRRLVRQARQRRAAELPPVAVHLRGGGTVGLRPMVPADAAAVIEHPERSSPDSRYRRFLRPAPSDRDLHHLADADYDAHFGWVALDDREVPVGEAQLLPTTAGWHGGRDQLLAGRRRPGPRARRADARGARRRGQGARHHPVLQRRPRRQRHHAGDPRPGGRELAARGVRGRARRRACSRS